MRVLGPGVDLQLGGHLASQAGLRQHPGDGVADHLIGVLDHQVAVPGGGEAPRVPAVTVGELALRLARCEHHLVGVHHDDVVTGVEVRGEHRLVLAPQHRGHLGGQPAEHQAVGVDDAPGTGDVGWFGGVRAHEDSLFSGAGQWLHPGVRGPAGSAAPARAMSPLAKHRCWAQPGGAQDTTKWTRRASRSAPVADGHEGQPLRWSRLRRPAGGRPTAGSTPCPRVASCPGRCRPACRPGSEPSGDRRRWPRSRRPAGFPPGVRAGGVHGPGGVPEGVPCPDASCPDGPVRTPRPGWPCPDAPDPGASARGRCRTPAGAGRLGGVTQAGPAGVEDPPVDRVVRRRPRHPAAEGPEVVLSEERVRCRRHRAADRGGRPRARSDRRGAGRRPGR